MRKIYLSNSLNMPLAGSDISFTDGKAVIIPDKSTHTGTANEINIFERKDKVEKDEKNAVVTGKVNKFAANEIYAISAIYFMDFDFGLISKLRINFGLTDSDTIIPSVAKKLSKNETSQTAKGLKIHIIKHAKPSEFSASPFLENKFPLKSTLIIMKERTTLTENEEKHITQNENKIAIILAPFSPNLNFFIRTYKPYTHMDICRPETAIMCVIPAALKSEYSSSLSLVLSPNKMEIANSASSPLRYDLRIFSLFILFIGNTLMSGLLLGLSTKTSNFV